MGLLSKARARARRAVKRAASVAKAVHEEARHPGRPASYQAVESPFWQDADVAAAARATPDLVRASSAPTASASPPPVDPNGPGRADEPFWFESDPIPGEEWHDTNPGPSTDSPTAE